MASVPIFSVFLASSLPHPLSIMARTPPRTRKRRQTSPPPPPRKRQTNRKRIVSPEPIPEDTTDPTIVTEPVDEYIHEKLEAAWKVHPKHQMCYIFDFVTPGRQWKRGTKYTEQDPFADYGLPPWPDLTETDDLNVLKPYRPRAFT